MLIAYLEKCEAYAHLLLHTICTTLSLSTKPSYGKPNFFSWTELLAKIFGLPYNVFEDNDDVILSTAFRIKFFAFYKQILIRIFI